MIATRTGSRPVVDPSTGPPRVQVRGRGRDRDLLIVLSLIAVTLAVYAQVHGHGFIVVDDMHYVAGNARIQAGMTLDNVRWAFGAVHGGNWHPLTTLSHMFDCEWFGLNAGAHHLNNVMLHVANTVLLFFVLRRMTAAPWPSAFTAALFALHPLHVESVAWISERKDVLSTFFWMLALAAYARYAASPRVSRYLAVVVAFGLGLLSKPMVVTLPLVLLLLDVWPLHRLAPERRWRSAGRLVLEKVPLLLMSAAASLVTLFVQRGAMEDLRTLSLPVRLGNAVVSYGWYLGKMVWPTDLAILYPHSFDIDRWTVFGACLLLVAVSVVSAVALRSRPYLLTGWLWYGVTLVPVIGLVQVGEQSRADRYTYIPLIGIFVMIAWAGAELTRRGRVKPWIPGVAAAAILAALAVISGLQVARWKDDLTLLTHSTAVTRDNHALMTDLALALAEAGRPSEALTLLDEVLRIRPGYPRAHSLLGILTAGVDPEGAIGHFRAALRGEPEIADSHFNLGMALLLAGRIDEGAERLIDAVEIDPDHARARDRLAQLYLAAGSPERALPHLRELVRLRPRDPATAGRLGLALMRTGAVDDAIRVTRQALALAERRNLTQLAEELRDQLRSLRAPPDPPRE